MPFVPGAPASIYARRTADYIEVVGPGNKPVVTTNPTTNPVTNISDYGLDFFTLELFGNDTSNGPLSNLHYPNRSVKLDRAGPSTDGKITYSVDCSCNFPSPIDGLPTITVNKKIIIYDSNTNTLSHASDSDDKTNYLNALTTLGFPEDTVLNPFNPVELSNKIYDESNFVWTQADTDYFATTPLYYGSTGIRFLGTIFGKAQQYMPWLEKAYPGFTTLDFNSITLGEQVPEFLLRLQLNLQGRSALLQGYIDQALPVALGGGVFYTTTPPPTSS